MKRSQFVISACLLAVSVFATGAVRSETTVVPEISNDNGHRVYAMVENPDPDACLASRENREVCDRWYHVGEESITIRGINFDFNKSSIRPDSASILNKNLEALKAKGNPKIRVIGHTDSVGSDSYNQSLSERRASSVKSYMVNKGYSADKIMTEGHGEREPVAPNTVDGRDNPEGRFKNRRVEIHFK